MCPQNIVLMAFTCKGDALYYWRLAHSCRPRYDDAKFKLRPSMFRKLTTHVPLEYCRMLIHAHRQQGKRHYASTLIRVDSSVHDVSPFVKFKFCDWSHGQPETGCRDKGLPSLAATICFLMLFIQSCLIIGFAGFNLVESTAEPIPRPEASGKTIVEQVH